MKRILDISLLIILAILSQVATGCRHSANSGDDEPAGMAVLTLKVSLDAFAAYSRAGEELPVDDGEKMHTLRIIIVDAAGYAEHNSLWDLRNAPDVVATGQDFPIKAGESKTIILVANEDGATITNPVSGTQVGAAEYFAAINAGVGQYVDIPLLETITMGLDANVDATRPGTQMHSPLLMSAIHNYYIGTEPRYSASFMIHRAAVKYTYRITNGDKSRAHTVSAVGINNVAPLQFLFPDAEYAPGQSVLTGYTPAASAGSEYWFPVDVEIPSGATVELSPIYLPEGPIVADDSSYRTGFVFDGVSVGWRNIEWMPLGASSAVPEKMTDLPRNTNVVINVQLNYTDFTVDYTVCPWQTSEIDIPSFN